MGKEETLLGKLGKLISSLILLGVSSSWFVFTIWGISTWNDTASLVNNKITIILLYIPLFIGMFILFIIVMAIGSAAIKGKKKESLCQKALGGSENISYCGLFCWSCLGYKLFLQ